MQELKPVKKIVYAGIEAGKRLCMQELKPVRKIVHAKV